MPDFDEQDDAALLDQPDQPDQPDEPDEPVVGLNRAAAVYWGMVFGIAVAIMLLLGDWLSRNVSGAICIGGAGECNFAVLAINKYGFGILAVYAVIAALWAARAKPRDAHPWLVNIAGWLGVIASFYVIDAVATPLSQALPVKRSIVTMAILVLVATATVALSTLFRPKRPRQWWRRMVVVALPAVAISLLIVTIRSDSEIREAVTDAARMRVQASFTDAADRTRLFPKRQRKKLAGEWLDQPQALDSVDGAAAFAQTVGAIDAVGHGRDFRRVVERVLDRAAREEISVEEAAVAVGKEGFLQNIYVIGRRGAGYCLTETTTFVDPDKPFDMFGRFPLPVVSTKHRPRYCIVDDTLHGFDGSDEPRLAGTLGCVPSRPPSPDATDPAEREAVRFLTEAAASDTHDDGHCPEPLERLSNQVRPQPSQSIPPTFTRDFPTLDRDEAWADQVANALGLAPPPLDAESFDEVSPTVRVQLLLRVIERAQRGPSVPRQEALEPHFGDIVDAFSTYRLNRILDATLERLRPRGAKTVLDELAAGTDVARFIVGQKRSGWCKYRLRVEAAPGRHGEAISATLTYELRYCLAGSELLAFDDQGGVERRWDATGFSRRAPLFDPADNSQFNGLDRDERKELDDRAGRDALIERFLEGLVAGKLDDVSQLETISLARGADLIDPSTKEAMRRMLRQSSDAAD